MIKWKRPSGLMIETGEGEGAEAYAKEHGWVRADGAAQGTEPEEVEVEQDEDEDEEEED